VAPSPKVTQMRHPQPVRPRYLDASTSFRLVGCALTDERPARASCRSPRHYHWRQSLWDASLT
jgi:hypothetical protein